MQTARIVFAALALSVLVAAPAQADTLNDLFLVIENPDGFDGNQALQTTFGDGEFHDYLFVAPTHTIVNFGTFLGGTYPFPMAMDPHGTDAGTLFETTGFFPGDFDGQPFFLIGTATPDEGGTHLVLSNGLDAPPLPGFPDDLESVVIDNLASLDDVIGALEADGGVASLFGVEGDGLSALVASLVAGFEGEGGFGTLFGFVNAATSNFSTTGDGISNIFGFTDPVLLGTATVTGGGTGGTWDPLTGRTDPVPEPGTLALCGLFAAGIVWRRRRRSA